MKPDDLDETGTPDATREAPCPRYATCGGCDLMHIPEDSQRRAKIQRLLDLLRSVELAPAGDILCLVPPREWAYRHVMDLVCLDRGETGVLLAFPGSSAPEKAGDLDTCPVAAPPIERALAPLARAFAAWAGPRPTRLSLIASTDLDRLIVRLEGPFEDTRTFHRLAREMIRGVPGLSGVGWVRDTGTVNAGTLAMSDEMGPTKLWFVPPSVPGSFPEMDGSLARRALSELGAGPADRVLDLAAGTGLFSRLLAPTVERVYTLEESEAGIESIFSNMSRHELGNFSLVQGPLEVELPKLLEEEPPPTRALVHAPPEGFAPGVLEALAGVRPRRIVYHARSTRSIPVDLPPLAAMGYRPVAVILVDTAPQTRDHETLITLE